MAKNTARCVKNQKKVAKKTQLGRKIRNCKFIKKAKQINMIKILGYYGMPYAMYQDGGQHDRLKIKGEKRWEKNELVVGHVVTTAQVWDAVRWE